ncbi:MAG: TIGR03790 family protein, partial [Burkholderiales bacterium]|nr:TIGR03790 family protein [Opitutaceae bacterium]
MKPRLEIRGHTRILSTIVRFHVLVFLLSFASGLWATSSASAATSPTVAILANRDDPDSLELARHYAKCRGLPDTMIVALPMPLTEYISWDEFVVMIWNPLLKEIVKRDWMLASLGEDKDAIGRLRIVPSGHRLEALVICRGVPLRIAHDPARYDPATNPLTANAALRNNTAAVDSELALLAVANAPVAAFVPNPLYEQKSPSSVLREQIIPVGRLDGPTLADAKGLVDRALIAERDGLAGRAYLDIGGPHPQGDDWLEACLPELQSLGFETDAERSKATLTVSARFDAPVFYFGWYAGSLDGPFTAPDFRFPPGAIALHIHSFSADTVRSPTRGWTGPLIAKGATATFGNVAEPYLQFTHQPQLLLRALLRGEPMGRAALYSINALSWQALLVGDPLYRPFAVSADAQWARRKELPPATESYARIRRMRLLVAAGRGPEAISLGLAGLAQNPTLPLALTLAGLQLSAGDNAGSLRTLGVFTALRKIRPADRPLALVAARAA